MTPMLVFLLAGCPRAVDAGADSDLGGPFHISGDFVALSASQESRVCVVDAAGGVRCWYGEDAPCRATTFSEPASQVVADSPCALLASGTVECADFDGEAHHVGLPGMFAAFGSSGDRVCGVGMDGLACTEQPRCGPAQPAIPDPVAVVVGHWGDDILYGCVSDVSGLVTCWGNYPGSECGDSDGGPCQCESTDPPLVLGPYAQFARSLCGVTFDGRVDCPRSSSGAAPPDATYIEVAGHYGYGIVAVTEDGSIAYGALDSRDPSARETPEARFVHADSAMDMTCGIDTEGDLWCWGIRAEVLRACE